MTLPYELIGRIVVGVMTILLAIGAIGLALFTIAFIWVRGWTAISELMWRGYAADGEWPPLWRSRIAAITYCMSRLKIRKMPAAYREATERAGESA